MTALTSWDEVWKSLDLAFAALAGRLAEHNPGLWWVAGHVSTEAFAFTGYLSFNRQGLAGEEDIVVSVGVQQRGDRLVWTSDIDTGDGEVLADGPTCTAAAAAPMATWVGPVLADTVRFLDTNEPPAEPAHQLSLAN